MQSYPHLSYTRHFHLCNFNEHPNLCLFKMLPRTRFLCRKGPTCNFSKTLDFCNEILLTKLCQHRTVSETALAISFTRVKVSHFWSLNFVSTELKPKFPRIKVDSFAHGNFAVCIGMTCLLLPVKTTSQTKSSYVKNSRHVSGHAQNLCGVLPNTNWWNILRPL